MSGQLHAPAALSSGAHWIGGCVITRARLDDLEKRKFLTLPRLELQPFIRSARSQSLYQLRYPGSLLIKSNFKKVPCN
jgi:hypothetical protein